MMQFTVNLLQEGAEEEVEVVEHSVKKRSTENLILELAIFRNIQLTRNRFNIKM